MRLALPLFVFWIGTDDKKLAFSFHKLAFIADLFD
jgi:hypothetical protein